MHKYYLDHLQELEAEAIFVIREVVAQFDKPAILFSGGKDSIVVTHLARKAFSPAKIPLPLIHIDTGHNFQETMVFRDNLVKELGVQLIVGSVQESIDKGRAKEETGMNASRNALQTVTLLDTIEEYKIDAAIGVRAAMKKKPVQKNVSSHTAMTLASGIQRTSVPSFGTSSTAVKTRANIFACSRFPTGLKWMCGIIFYQKEFPFLPSTSPTTARLYTVMVAGSRYLNSFLYATAKPLNANTCDSARWAILPSPAASNLTPIRLKKS